MNTTKEKNYLITNQNQILEGKVIERTKELQLQTDKTERLMLNILPQSIADRLKQGDREISDKYQNTTNILSDKGKSYDKLFELLIQHESFNLIYIDTSYNI